MPKMPKIDVSLRSAIYFKGQSSPMDAGNQKKNILEYLAFLIYYNRQNTSTLGILGISLKNLVYALKCIWPQFAC